MKDLKDIIESLGFDVDEKEISEISKKNALKDKIEYSKFLDIMAVKFNKKK